MSRYWWTAENCAGTLNITTADWLAQVADGKAPPPEHQLDDAPAWNPDTVAGWALQRPREHAD